MKVARNLMIEVVSLHKDEYVTRARQVLRDDVCREIYITDEKQQLAGMIDITDVLKVTDTRSNVTISGFIREAAAVTMDTPLEEVASAIFRAGVDSAAVIEDNGTFMGAILLRDLFPILVSRHEVAGLIEDSMTKRVISCDAEDSMQKVYSLIIESGFSSLPILSKKRLVGIISRRDLIEKGGIRRSLGNSTITQVNRAMTTAVITARPDEPVSDAAKQLVSHDISRIPVVVDGIVIGILDRHDVLKTLVTKA
jgi:CBS domain-containing protein